MYGHKRRSGAVALALAGLLLAGTACESRDRAGGSAGTEATVLTLANIGGTIRPGQLEEWAREVRRRSKGSLRIEFRDEYREGEKNAETATVQDVRQNKVDLAWVGVRVLDRVGAPDFQALLAPLLVDSYELQAAVFEAGVADRMAAGLADAGLHAVGVLPGPLKRVVGVERPVLDVRSFAGRRFAVSDSSLVESTYRALGATPVPAPADVDLAGFDGVEFQLGTVVGRHTNEQAGYVTGNLDLWPRPLAVLMSPAAHDRLTGGQRELLARTLKGRQAAAIDAAREEDRESAKALCGLGMEIPSSSAAQLRALRDTVQPVYDELRRNARTAGWLDEIEALKKKTGAAPDSASCRPKQQVSSPLEGTWKRTMTDDDWIALPKDRSQGPPNGTWTITFHNGVLTKTDPGGDVEQWAYEVFRDRMHASGTVEIDATFRLSGDRLTFGDFGFGTCTDCQGYEITFGGGKKPWIRSDD
ncbi:TRAP transporter substrate-binding protein DctP [Streptomyces sp. NPDC051940]|uniref:TRAP transporter substrate-binding protein n=1 Tax=Streptomyces sp. NPDC051940 TaxID=3155675 RepID=UPI00342649B4